MGLYQFCRIPFGLTGAPASFQRLMNRILRGLPFASTYIDDILVFSSDLIKHKELLHQVFKHLKEAGLTLRDKKCHIGLTQMTYLGHVFSAKGMSPDPRKTQAIVEWLRQRLVHVFVGSIPKITGVINLSTTKKS